MSLTPQQQDRLVRLTRYGRNFFAFCREVLGYADALTVEDEVVSGYSHEDLCRFLQFDAHQSKLILMPRYTFKSHIVTIGYTLWRLTQDDSLRILIYSDTNDKSEGFLEGIKNQIEGKAPRSKFRETYGAWETDPKTGLWNNAAMTIRPRQAAHVEPTYDTAGQETSKTGKHYDLIVFDDCVSEKTVTTPEQLQKTKEVYRKALSLLKPGGEILVVGTRWHFGDLYGEILAKEQERARLGQDAVFAIHHRQAEVDGQYPFARIGLTKDFLAHQKAEQGSYTYSALYQNAPTDDESATFKAKDFAFYPPEWRQAEDWVHSLYLTACVDPAISQAGGADDTAITVVGTDVKGDLYLLDLVGGKLLPDQIVDSLFALHARWNLRTVGIETNAFQRMLARDVQRRLDHERANDPNFRLFHLEHFTGTSAASKEQRIMGLQPYHERGALKFPGERLELLSGHYLTLAYQLLQFPRSAHDDYADSLAYHIPLHRKGFVKPEGKTLPRTSAAWYERDVWQKQFLKERERLPRRHRPPVPALAFS